MATAGYIRTDLSIFYFDMLGIHANNLDTTISHAGTLAIKCVVVFMVVFIKCNRKQINLQLLKTDKPFLKKLIVALPMGIFLSFCFDKNDDVAQSALYLFGGTLPEDIFPLTYILYVLPIFIQIWLFADIMRNDFGIASNYLLIRIKNRHVWYVSKLISIVFLVVVFNVVLIAGFMGALFIRTAAIVGFEMIVDTLITIFFTYVFFNMIVVVFINIMAIRFKSNLVVVVSLIVLFPLQIISCLLPVGFLDGILIKFNPFTQSIIPLHDIKTLSAFFSNESIPGFYREFTLVYNILLLAILVYYGLRCVQNMDLMGEC